MVQRWSIASSAYSYDIHHRSAQSIPHADYLSRYAISEEASTGDCLLTQLLPVSRSDLVRETRKYYHAIISCVRRGWRGDIKRRFPEFYKRHEEIPVTCDGVLCYNDRIITAFEMDSVASIFRVMAKNTCGLLRFILQHILSIGDRRFLFPLATTPSSEFTIRALSKTFSREGVPHAIVTEVTEVISLPRKLPIA
ncbi:unnamed protein product [Echinostoma caproni]|uniref:DUF61 family protein n=1 Tax=Echinostoma caproni TaxID=27848 RepID=A0A183ABN0_9TREM|nr:unnamed protein product [Echinostoma caproni]